jgi:hypothetical protein
MSIAKRALELRKNSQLRNRIEAFLSGKEDQIFHGKYIYNGKSKIIKTKEVEIIKDLNDKCRIKDLQGNTSTVSKSKLTKI